ncbi:TIGR00341 family protein [Marinilongibacter aquaticus]|uniref:TIGR00341 family protein n=1 Tax=Marinilongibacter aquaticus TaxID=2975157 RepID=UPI0021BD6BA6|nr:TIGR00341 family protein [Marinilongibacter aquaticus]UBM59378.1 TIGR00341 family protein [Marinilongibacter aquaticus]
MNQVWKELKDFLSRLLDLHSDRASYNEIIENIEKGVEFRGTNLWILIFAILVASVGLNMNSTAVVIGAMLISPLMGPIMGIGLGVGIYDFPLIKKSFRSLVSAMVISILASAIYFALTPISDAQSELLSRTTPAIWDVFIAFFGGLAGIVAVTRKDKGNAIPGVAIATALMPPLCTAGYGIATLNWHYFLGAFYLFFINSVFISVASMLIIRFMRIPSKKWVDMAQQRKMKAYVAIVAVVTIIPSLYLGYDIVKRSFFRRNAIQFITEEFTHPDTRVIEQDIEPNENRIEVFLFGSELPESEIYRLNSELKDYNLDGADLIIRQNKQNLNVPSVEAMRAGIIEELYRKNEDVIKNKDEKIALLENELSNYHALDLVQDDVAKELTIQYPEIEGSAFGKTRVHLKKGKVDTVTMVYLDTRQAIRGKRLKTLQDWLEVRLKSKDIRIVQE